MNRENLENLWKSYLALPQNIRFGIPVVAGMLIVLPIVWSWLDRPPTCEEAKAHQAKLDRRDRDGSAQQFKENMQAIADVYDACLKGK